jgi:tyrosinase
MSTPPNPKVPRIPELVGATSSPIQLGGSPTQVAIRVQEPTGPASEMVEALADWAPRRVFLNIEKIISEAGAPPFFVYLNVPPGDNPIAHPELFAGDLPMFGLREVSISDEAHTPNGLYTQLDVTNLYRRLSLLDNWDPKNLRVTFVPKFPGNLPPIQVGRVSLYFA